MISDSQKTVRAAAKTITESERAMASISRPAAVSQIKLDRFPQYAPQEQLQTSYVSADHVVSEIARLAAYAAISNARRALAEEIEALNTVCVERGRDAEGIYMRLQRLASNSVIESQISGQRRALERANDAVRSAAAAAVSLARLVAVCDRAAENPSFVSFVARIDGMITALDEADPLRERATAELSASKSIYSDAVAAGIDMTRDVTNYAGEGRKSIKPGSMSRETAESIISSFSITPKGRFANPESISARVASLKYARLDEVPDPDSEDEESAASPDASVAREVLRLETARETRAAQGLPTDSAGSESGSTFVEGVRRTLTATQAGLLTSAYKHDFGRSAATGAKSSARLAGAKAAATEVISSSHANPLRARVNYMVSTARRRLHNMQNTSNPRIGFEREDESRETSALASAVIRPIGSAFASESPDTAAMRVAEFFSGTSIFRSDANDVLSGMLLPLISEARFCVNTSDWTEIGYALHTAYGHTDIGRETWSRLTAQRTLIARIRKWFVERNPEHAERIAATNFREFSQWVSGVSSPGIEFLRGEDENACFEALGADETSLASLFSSANQSTYSEEIQPARASEALLSDTVASVGAPFITKFFADGWNREVSSAIRRGQSPSDIAESFMNFRRSFFMFRKSVYEEVSRQFKEAGDAPEKSLREYANDFVRRVFSDPSDLANPRRHKRTEAEYLQTKADARADRSVQGAVDRAVFAAVTDLDEKAAVRVVEDIATQEIDSILTPQDYAWSSACEKSAAAIFGSRLGKTAADFEARRKEFAEKFLADNPEFAAAFERGINASEDVGVLLSALSLAENQDEFRAIFRLGEEAVQRDEGISASVAEAWQNFKPFEARVTARTLATFAAVDCPREFGYWYSRWVDSSIIQATEEKVTRDRYVGEFAARALWLTYICSPGASASARPVWLKFGERKHYLRRIGGTSELETDISTRVSNLLDRKYDSVVEEMHRDQYRSEILSSRAASGDQAERLKLQAKGLQRIAEALAEIRKSFGSPRGISGVIDAMRMTPFVKIANFTALENVNEYLIAFENGVTDCSGKNMIFRAGKIEDYVTKSTRISMPIGGAIRDPFGSEPHTPFGLDHPDMQRLFEYLGMVFTDAELCEYMQIDFASFLVKRNYEKKVRLWTGTGNNSKSILIKILQDALGEYTFDIPPETLSTGTKSSGSAPSPEIAQGDGAALGISSEPKSGLTLDAGFIKRVTGGDRTYSRKLFEDGCSKISSWKLILGLNDTPDISSYDDASRGRFLIVPFDSVWCVDAPDSIEEQYRTRRFKIDPHFERNVPRLARALAWLMFHRFDDYRAHPNRDTPVAVKESIRKYWAEHDKFQEFVSDCIEDSPTASVTMPEVYARFIEWHTERDGSRGPSIAEVRREMLRKDRLGEFTGGKNTWRGFRVAARTFTTA